MPLRGPTLAAPFDLTRLLDGSVRDRPDEDALTSLDESLTWRGLADASDRLARRLLGLGLRPGDRVASLMPNRVALAVHYLACMKAGLVATPLNYRYTPPEIDYALGVAVASLLLADAERAGDIAASAKAGALPCGLVAFDGDMDGARRFEDLVNADAPQIALPAPDPSAPALLYFTSGSTGKPKGVVHTLETMGWLTASMAHSLELTPDDVVLPGSSFAHIVGTTTIVAALCAGARVAVARDFDGDALLALCRKTRPTVMNILPLPLRALIEDRDAAREDFGPLRLCLSGSDKLTGDFEREFLDLVGFQIHEGYGMTEAGLTHFNPASGPNKPGSIGPTTAGYATSIRDESGAEVPAGVDGRLWIKGPAVTVGYWRDPAATAEAIVDGWLDTGDIVRADDDGYLWFQGRRKQIIIHDGSNISPQEVEEALESHPAVADAGVVGVRDALHGENVWAYVTLKDGVARPSSGEIIRHARSRIGYKAPEAVFVLDEMPRNATGKVDRESLKKLAAERAGADCPD